MVMNVSTIGEARPFYKQQLAHLAEQKRILEKRLNDTENPLTDNDRGVILELSEQVNADYDKTNEFMKWLSEKENMLRELENSKEQSKSAGKMYQDMAKCMEIARRIAKGDKVPPSDEKKLMEFDKDMWLQAKMARKRKKTDKKHKSLWEDEEPDEMSIDEKVDATEISVATPRQSNVDISVAEVSAE